MDTAAPLIPSEVTARVGAVVSIDTGLVARRDWERWAYAVGDLNLLYFDADYARTRGYKDVICPPLYLPHVVLGALPLEEFGADGVAAGTTGGLELPRCRKWVAGSEDITFHGVAYDGDLITSVRALDSVVEKDGRSGPFVLVTWRATYANESSELIAEATTQMIALP